jgi:CHAD domain-containing protein
MGSRAIGWAGGGPEPYRVRHVAPVAVYSRLAAVRAYDEWVSIPAPPVERLHALRISCKRLRYTMEFFEEVLGPDAKGAIREIVEVQDHLGDLQDAVVASAILRDYLKWGTWGSDADQLRSGQEATTSGIPLRDPGVEAFLAAKQGETQHLLDTFPQVWQLLTGANFGRMLAETVMVL